jgi:hypothetical protein
MDYSGAGATSLYKYQWDNIQDPQSMIGLLQGDEEGEYDNTPINKNFTLLFDHIFKGHRKKSYTYLDKINEELAKDIKIRKDDLSLSFQEGETDSWSKTEKSFVDQWKIRVRDANKDISDIIKAIQIAGDKEKIGTIYVRSKNIYLGKFTYKDIEYPVAIYGNGSKTEITNVLTKVQVTDDDLLEKTYDKKDIENKEFDPSLYIYCDETPIDYMIIGFLEKGKSEPTLIMQIEKFDISEWQFTKEKWLEYLNILIDKPKETPEKQILGNYIVFKDDANIRKKTEPYELLKPYEFLEKGKEVELISHLTTGNTARALVCYKNEKEEYCTSTGNLKQIISIEDEQQYKLRKEMAPFILPYSGETQNKIKTSEILYVTHDCGDYKCINKKDGDEYEILGWVKAENLKKYIDNSNLGKDEFSKKYLEATETAVNDIVEDWKTEEAACNLCVRAALYNLTGDEVLYPKIGSSTTIRDKGEQLYGKVEAGNGSAQGIIDDLKNGKLDDYFEEVTKQSGEKHTEYWSRLQAMVDNKEIIIGTYDPGHVFMLVPGGMYEVVDNTDRKEKGTYKTDSKPELGDRYGFTFASRKIDYVLRVMDCGAGLKFSNGPFYGAMDAAPLLGVAGRPVIKFYKYKQN